MHLLKALEKHIPAAGLLLEERPSFLEDKAEELWNSVDADKFEVLCVFGVSGNFYSLARKWLDEEGKRRLIFIEENGAALSQLLQNDDAILLLNDLRVKLFFLESPLQIKPLAKKVAWRAVFQEMAILLLRKSENGMLFREELQICHAAAHLLLSDSSDWGVSLLQNLQANRNRPCRSGLALKGKFEGIPALIVGAGPSLETNGHLIKEFENRGLILAGGSALNVLDWEPHFAASIDKEAPYRQFKMHPFFETPFCFQSRMNRDNFSLVHGPALLFPEQNAPWINWINGQEEGFDSGWTVGNFLTSFALFLGCNPIILVGMDLCYSEEKKYAHLETVESAGLIQLGNVWTQRDWLMAARWTEELAAAHPDRRWINASPNSICQIPFAALSDLINGPEHDLRRTIHEEIQSIPIMEREDLWEQWKSSLLRCKMICDAVARFDKEELEEEKAYQLLLKPLWDVWKPVFERELELDSQPISLLEKMDLNQILFFQQVLQEHIDVII